MDLAVPLSKRQIKAANELQLILAEGSPTDRALYALSDRFPGFDSDAVLLKVAAINQLYYTNVWAVTRMARHVAKVMNGPNASKRDYELIEELAALPKSERQQSNRNHLSFASKFAHFFIDAEAFPIYDTFAVRMIVHHLGWQATIPDLLHPYQAFFKNFSSLKKGADLSCTTRELDSYLWLAGLYREWKKSGDKARINTEVLRLFGDRSEKVQTILDALGHN